MVLGTVGSEPIGVHVDKEVVMTERKQYFNIENGPGPFQINADVVDLLRSEADLESFKFIFKLEPTVHGEKFFRRHSGIRIEFEAAFLGPAPASEYPGCIRLWGRFLPDFANEVEIAKQLEASHSLYNHISKSIYEAAAPLTAWQWEIIFHPKSRGGKVYLLDQPLFGENPANNASGNSGYDRKERALMIVVEKIVGRYRDRHYADLNTYDEEIFKLFELAKRIHRAENQNSLAEAIKDMDSPSNPPPWDGRL